MSLLCGVLLGWFVWVGGLLSGVFLGWLPDSWVGGCWRVCGTFGFPVLCGVDIRYHISGVELGGCGFWVF